MKAWMSAVTAVVVVFLVLPILALLPMSLSGTRWLALPPRDLSLRWYVTFFTDRDWIEATLVSLKVAAAATALAVALGTLAGAGLARGRFPGRGVVRSLALSPLVVPVMVLAVSLYYVFGRIGLVGTLTGLVLAHALHADGRTRPQAVGGVVEETIYLGGHLKYLVRINPSEVLVVRVPKQAGAPPLGRGTPVQVEWQPQELLLL